MRNKNDFPLKIHKTHQTLFGLDDRKFLLLNAIFLKHRYCNHCFGIHLQWWLRHHLNQFLLFHWLQNQNAVDIFLWVEEKPFKGPVHLARDPDHRFAFVRYHSAPSGQEAPVSKADLHTAIRVLLRQQEVALRVRRCLQLLQLRPPVQQPLVGGQAENGLVPFKAV